MIRVHEWLLRKASRLRKRPNLDEALFFGRQTAYALYRLRFLAIRSALRTIVHVLEVMLFALVVWPEFLPYFLVLRSGMAMFSGLYWGWLEKMREQVRESWRARQMTHVRSTIDRWLKLAGLTVVLQFIAMFAVLRFYPTPFSSFSILDAYIIACFIRLGLDTLSRTYHAGVYAIRRIYRPLSSLIAVELVEVAALLALIPWLGPWSFAPVLLLGGLVRAAFTFYFTARAYRQARIPCFRLKLFIRRALPSLSSLWSAAKWSAANFNLQLDAWLIVALVATDSADRSRLFVATLFHLFRPLIGSVASWARVFYFDFKRLETSSLSFLRERFERFLRRVAWAAALIVSALLLVAAPLVVGADLSWDLVAMLIPFLLLRSRLALVQVAAFSYGLYRHLFRLGLGVTAGLLLASLPGVDVRVTILLVSAALLATLLWVPKARHSRTTSAQSGRALGFYHWLAELNRVKEPVHVWIGRVNRRLTPCGRAVRELALRLPHARFTRFGRDTILWYESAPNVARDYRTQLLVSAAGVLRDLTSGKIAENGATALQKAIAELDQSDTLSRIFSGSFLKAAELVSQFSRNFPDGLMIDARSGAGSMRSIRPSNLYKRAFTRSVLQELRQQTQGGRKTKRVTAPIDISVFCPSGETRLIFAIPLAIAAQQRNDWRLLVQNASARTTLIESGPD